MLTYLALGDSYTIGEGVPIYDSFPYQLVQWMRKKGIPIHAPEIVARTGLTTDELSEAIGNTTLPPKFDLVTLLIGVNNQYRNRPANEYAEQFEDLLKTAIQFSKKKEQMVFVLSIPDWGVTPFADSHDKAQIEKEIDEFNQLNKIITKKYNCHYIDITAGTREAATDLTLIAPDKLHYSGKEHGRWVDLLGEAVMKSLDKTP